MVDRLFRLYPDFSPSDNFLIEDTKTGKVVAYYCLKLNTGVLGGQKIPVGQMEIVGTLEGYRTIDELHEIFPDAGGNATKTPIIRQIFPKLSAIGSPEF